MPWVVSRLCTDKLDTACAGECPVDCFYRPKSTATGLRNQLYISPDECIDCGACEPACPWEAIYEDASVPAVFNDDIAENAKSDSQRALFDAAVEDPNTPKPTSDQVLANKAAHGLT